MKRLKALTKNLEALYDAYHGKNLRGVDIKYPWKISNAYESPLPIPCDHL